MVPLFNSHNILVKSFTIVVTDFAEIFREKKFKCDSRKWIFSLILHPIALYEVDGSCTRSWYFATLWFPKKLLQILLNNNHVFLSVLFRSSSNCLSCISSLIWGPINKTSLIFVSPTFENLFFTYSNPRPFYPYLSQSFHEAQLYVQRGRKIFSGRTRGRLTTFFSLGVSDVRLDHSLFTEWFFLSRLSHLHRKQQYFVYPNCIPSNSATTLRSPHNFHLNSSYLTLKSPN